MKTQDYLKQIVRFESMIERKKEEISRYDIMICGIPGNELNPDKVQTSLSGDKMSSSIAKLVDSQREVQGLMELYLMKRKYIVSQIDNMPNDKSYSVLTDRYVLGKSIGEIAYSLKCTERRVKQLHAIALKEFEELYGEEYIDNPTIYS